MKYYGNFTLPLYLPKIEFNLCTPYRPPVSVTERNSYQQLILFVLQLEIETLILMYFKTMIYPNSSLIILNPLVYIGIP